MYTQTDNLVKSPRCLYNASLGEFLKCNNAEILGHLITSYHGDSQSTTVESWEEEIRILKEQFRTKKSEENAYFAHIVRRSVESSNRSLDVWKTDPNALNVLEMSSLSKKTKICA